MLLRLRRNFVIEKLFRKQRPAYYTCFFAKSSLNLMFKPIRSVVETIKVKLDRFCIPTCSLRLVLSFSSESLLNTDRTNLMKRKDV